ncbi:unnamed protein product [Phaedon cochleariae]|uniref:CRAL-TRIO domain-containing protein n=1 Tax=Phaedon cochleariae TaxID=80249 RepID=A0A9N9WY21_PHACE|nr:unnamed protein product [Phaedon cochleariae]
MENVKQCSEGEIYRTFEKSAKEKGVKRLDEEFLRRFLIGHQYDIITSLKAVRNFESFVDRRRSRWLKLDRNNLEKILLDQIVDVSDKNGLQGQKVVWIRLEKWDPQVFTADELLEVSGLLCELVYAKSKEIECIDVIVDLHNFSLRHLYGLSPKFAKRMVFFISQCLPMRLSHVYVVRQPKIFHLVYSLFKPFIEEKTRNLITVCGYDYDVMFATIGPDILPSEIGGTSTDLVPSRWLKILYNKRVQKESRFDCYFFEMTRPLLDGNPWQM